MRLATPLHPGDEAPDWADAGPSFARVVIAEEGNLVGFLFADPLRVAPRSDRMNNKILWVVREPRNGQPLSIDGSLDGDVVISTAPGNASPGEIYPSTVNVPKPGCWHFTLRWGDNAANLDLLFEP